MRKWARQGAPQETIEAAQSGPTQSEDKVAQSCSSPQPEDKVALPLPFHNTGSPAL